MKNEEIEKIEKMKNIIDAVINDTILGKTQIKDQLVEKIINLTLEKMNKRGFPLDNPSRNADKPLINSNNSSENSKKVCFCSDCFNFDTFEQVLIGKPGVFDNLEVILTGKKFYLKAFIGEDKNNFFMLKEAKNAINITDWTLEQCQEGLSEAVREKDYNSAQLFMNKVNNFKNQNKS